MARAPRIDVGGEIYHVINRANNRATIFTSEKEYIDFESLLTEMKERFDVRILAYVVMPNHWHLLLYPKNDKDMSKALQWLGTTHATRHHVRKKTIGGGHLYQGRYKSFIIQKDAHFLTVLKYIERNPVRAHLVKAPEAWQWGSAHRRLLGTIKTKKLLSKPPVDLPYNYRSWLSEAEPSELLKEVRNSVNKSTSYGEVVI